MTKTTEDVSTEIAKEIDTLKSILLDRDTLKEMLVFTLIIFAFLGGAAIEHYFPVLLLRLWQ